MIEKGTWVRIHKIILNSSERAASIPEDTRKVPYEMWVKGYLRQDSEIGETVSIQTLTGRMIEGELVEANPSFNHSYGRLVPELLKIGPQLKGILFGGDLNE